MKTGTRDSASPEPGLVIRYSYLWLREHRAGREEGVKDRPCAIVLTAITDDGATRVLVVPVTHSRPDDPDSSLELPASTRWHLGLDTDRCWVVLTESNVFDWPDPDLRPVGGNEDRSFAYGFLPPRFFIEPRRKFVALEAAA